MPPTYANGKICYIELPAKDVTGSADFYQRVFGWNIRKRGDGATAFDDGVGELRRARLAADVSRQLLAVPVHPLQRVANLG